MYSYTLLALAAFAEANPFLGARQAVTADLSPAAPAPPGCTGSVNYHFGIAANNVSSASVEKRQATQIGDGQVQAASASPAVSQITDGQVQAATGAPAVSQITDGQIQAATGAAKVLTMAPISMITDGQVQAGMHTMNIMPVAAASSVKKVAAVSQITDGQLQVPANAVTEITDGQVQAPATTTMMPVTESSDGQPVAPTGPVEKKGAPAVAEQTDGQPIAPVSSASPAVSEKTDGQPDVATSSASSTAAAPSSSSSSGGTKMQTCSGGALSITLEGTKLTDQKNRTGYIASNFQFQFDDPPQAGALYTSGFTICENGTLALGGSNIFYQCLSGNFYNIYDRKWAAQCSPAYIQTMEQVGC